jgi:hypothetical protein
LGTSFFTDSTIFSLKFIEPIFMPLSYPAQHHCNPLSELKMLLLGLCQPPVNAREPLVGLYVGQDAIEVGAVLLAFEVSPVEGDLILVARDASLLS